MSQTSRWLGYPADARLLIINADDFGMCQAVNEAIIQTLPKGVVTSTTLMVPCPWSHHAMHFLREHPDLSFGVHLTVISDWVNYRWRPLAPRDKVSSLIEKDGYFYTFAQMGQLLSQVRLDELELEFRMQIEAVLTAGLQPTHIDWHSLRISGRTDILDLMRRLAQSYGLAMRVMGQPWIQTVQRAGLPTIDYDFLDSYVADPDHKRERFRVLLRELPAGLSEWAIHPGIDSPELRTIDAEGYRYRQADYDFLQAAETKQLLEEEGIILLNYRALQPFWART